MKATHNVDEVIFERNHMLVCLSLSLLILMCRKANFHQSIMAVLRKNIYLYSIATMVRGQLVFSLLPHGYKISEDKII